MMMGGAANHGYQQSVSFVGCPRNWWGDNESQSGKVEGSLMEG